MDWERFPWLLIAVAAAGGVVAYHVISRFVETAP